MNSFKGVAAVTDEPDGQVLRRLAAGLAGQSGCLVMALGVRTFGGRVEEWTSEDWLACAEVLTSLRGFIGTRDVVSLLHTLPPSMRASLLWPAAYDMTAERALVEGVTEEAQPADLDAVEAMAVAAMRFVPTLRVETSLATGLLMALNASPLRVDLTVLASIAAAHMKTAVELGEDLQRDLPGVLLRTVTRNAVYKTLSQDPVWLARFNEWRRADLVATRAQGLGRWAQDAEQLGGGQVLARPTWRLHRHWACAASSPGVHVLPNELRVAFPAEPGRIWVSLALEHPHVRLALVEWIEAGGDAANLDVAIGESVLHAFSRRCGFDTMTAHEGVLVQQADEARESTVYAALGEIQAWVLRQAWAWSRFAAPPMAWVRGAAFLQAPRGVDLLPFLQHLHHTLVTTPRVLSWRTAGALHWTVGAGSTWGAVRPLNPDAIYWPAEMQLL